MFLPLSDCPQHVLHDLELAVAADKLGSPKWRPLWPVLAWGYLFWFKSYNNVRKVPGMGLNGTLGYNMNLLTELSELLVDSSPTYSVFQCYVNLGHNQLSDINVVFNQLTNLTTFYLQNNQFTGTIDVLTDLPLTDLNIANNQFSGSIPDKLKSIGNLQTSGNSFSNSPAPVATAPPSDSPPSRPSPSSSHSNDNSTRSRGSDNDNSSSGSKSSKVGNAAVAGIVITLVVVGALVAFFLIKRKSMKRKQGGDPEKNAHLSPLASGKIKQLRPIRSISLSTTGKELRKNVSMNLKPPSKIELHKSYENDPTNNPIVKEVNLSSIGATAYTVADLQVLAVKKINFSAIPDHPSDFFMKLVADIAKLNHPNLSEIDGYCSEHGQCLLAYEFYKNGSLHDFLHLSDGNSRSLSWHSRVKIALGSAQGIRESDDNSGYSAPEVIMSGQYSQKSDVYSFGVVMLELLTGRKAFDSSQPRSQQSLVRWATPQLHDIDSLDQMVDPALEGLYPAKSLSRFADAVALCVQPEPEFRPPILEVVQSLVRLVQRSSMGAGLSSERNSWRFDGSGDHTF
ncbi:hypothetical protein HU200_034943 [Digitaria exilis]|uniref:Protein kinase domain-containing protein n=1 Tax=Digitaria exilis TaxID=1010633 RepID=A0A835BGV4_9POAL|nr:hypothetical protein HU200_034943 [Digitaria exilis]